VFLHFVLVLQCEEYAVSDISAIQRSYAVILLKTGLKITQTHDVCYSTVSADPHYADLAVSTETVNYYYYYNLSCSFRLY